ncbi:BLUF domain-containing protein [Microbacterium oleivorans]|uniref:BLUF domain-containing protein n=1 Tax=Microbacterium oleivorans TaxID=273677 RepID=UPI00080EC8DA|nr:BLUF domain-containing protein [Microbacterium oleivorans]
MTDQLTFIAYASRATEPFDHARLVELLAESRANNERDGITGMLVYSDPDFIQILEGPDAAVRALLERIGRDPRHTDVRVLLEEQVSERKYSTWSMGYEPTTPGDGADAAVAAAQSATDDASTRESTDALGGWFREKAGAERD